VVEHLPFKQRVERSIRSTPTRKCLTLMVGLFLLAKIFCQGLPTFLDGSTILSSSKGGLPVHNIRPKHFHCSCLDRNITARDFAIHFAKQALVEQFRGHARPTKPTVKEMLPNGTVSHAQVTFTVKFSGNAKRDMTVNVHYETEEKCIRLVRVKSEPVQLFRREVREADARATAQRPMFAIEAATR
jgi:hypothetical protein